MKYVIYKARNGYTVTLEDEKSFMERCFVVEGAADPVAALKRALVLDEDQREKPKS